MAPLCEGGDTTRSIHPPYRHPPFFVCSSTCDGVWDYITRGNSRWQAHGYRREESLRQSQILSLTFRNRSYQKREEKRRSWGGGISDPRQGQHRKKVVGSGKKKKQKVDGRVSLSLFPLLLALKVKPKVVKVLLFLVWWQAKAERAAVA